MPALAASDADPYRRARYLPAVREVLQLLADRLDRIATRGGACRDLSGAEVLLG